MPRASTASRLKQILTGISRSEWIAMYDLGEVGADKIIRALPLMDAPRTAKGLSGWFQRIAGIGPERADSIAAQVWQEYEEAYKGEHAGEVDTGIIDSTPARPGLGAGE